MSSNAAEKMVGGLVIGAGAIVVVGGAVLLGFAGGAISGWIVQHSFLSDYILPGFKFFGLTVEPEQLPAIGAVIGWIGGFFRSTTSHKKD